MAAPAAAASALLLDAVVLLVALVVAPPVATRAGVPVPGDVLGDPPGEPPPLELAGVELVDVVVAVVVLAADVVAAVLLGVEPDEVVSAVLVVELVEWLPVAVDVSVLAVEDVVCVE